MSVSSQKSPAMFTCSFLTMCWRFLALACFSWTCIGEFTGRLRSDTSAKCDLAMLLFQARLGHHLAVRPVLHRGRPISLCGNLLVGDQTEGDLKERGDSTHQTRSPLLTKPERYVQLVLARANDGLDTEVRDAMQEFVQTRVEQMPFEKVYGNRSFWEEIVLAGYAFRNAQYANDIRRMFKISTREDKEYREAFDRIDVDKSGSIDRFEIRQIFEQVLGDDVLDIHADAHADAFMHQFDINEDRRISWEEFSDAKYENDIRHMLRLWDRSDDEYREAFDRIDVDNSGHIERCEIKEVFNEVLVDALDNNVDAFLQLFDTNQDESISWEEFSDALGVMPPVAAPQAPSEVVRAVNDEDENKDFDGPREKGHSLQWQHPDKEYREAFDRLDVGKNGHIKRSEVRRIFRDVLGDALDKNVDVFLQLFDSNGNDSISWAQFSDALGVMPLPTPHASLAAGHNRPPPGPSGKVSGADAGNHLEALREKALSLQGELSDVQKSKQMEQLEATTSLGAYMSSLSESQHIILRGRISEDVSIAMTLLITSMFRDDVDENKFTFTEKDFPSICFTFLIYGYRLREMEALGAAGQQKHF